MIIDVFPAPPPLVAAQLDRLRALRQRSPAALAALDPAELSRPWEPASCVEELREQLWWWCDEVAAWINHDYSWRPAQLIPACWPAHPHLAHDLPVVACLRVEADASIDPAHLELWHREILPAFLERMTSTLGESCRTGTHTDWPAAARHDAYFNERGVTDRQERIYLDSHPDARPGPSNYPDIDYPDTRPEAIR